VLFRDDGPGLVQALGAALDDAKSIASYFFERVYPLRKTENPTYWSPDCKGPE
jgi:hypothetical protein